MLLAVVLSRAFGDTCSTVTISRTSPFGARKPHNCLNELLVFYPLQLVENITANN